MKLIRALTSLAFGLALGAVFALMGFCGLYGGIWLSQQIIEGGFTSPLIAGYVGATIGGSLGVLIGISGAIAAWRGKHTPQHNHPGGDAVAPREE